MISIAEIQSIGIFLFGFLIIAVANSPFSNAISMRRQSHIYNESRWLLIYALTLFLAHYLLQRCMGFRQIGEQQAALINIIFYTPAIIFVHLSLLNLLHFGERKRWHDIMGGSLVAAIYLLLFLLGMTVEGGLMGHSPIIRRAEYTISTVTSILILFYYYDEWKQYHRIVSNLDDFYDSPQQEFIRWFATSVVLLAILSFLTPFLIYISNMVLLTLHGMLAFGAIGFLTLNFLHYGTDGSMMKMFVAHEETQGTQSVAKGAVQKAESAEISLVALRVNQWLASRRYLQSGLNAEEISKEIGIDRNLLKIYLQSQHYPKISSWLAVHRIEEAKRMLLSHPEYSHDVIAEQCGFSSREYFQISFRNIVGIPPMQWQRENK